MTNPNLWQYVVLLEGLGAVATAAGLAFEALRRDALRYVGYANVGVALIALSECANISATLDSHPTGATWIAAVGFGLYFAATTGSMLFHDGLRRLDRVLHRGAVARP